MFGLLWAASSLSTSLSMASTDEEAGSKPYKENVIEINLLYPGGYNCKIKCLHMFSMI